MPSLMQCVSRFKALILDSYSSSSQTFPNLSLQNYET
jgi:hypothetical protein